MKNSNLFLMALCLVIIAGMCSTNVILKNEYDKVDLTDPYKNYLSVDSSSYSVLDISGSNGYPIEIAQHRTNDIKVLRSRLGHFKSDVKNDTLFIQFTGSNIPMNQRYNSNTPPGVIIETNELSSIIITNTHNRVSGFANQNLELTLKGNSLMEISNCDLHALAIDMINNSQIDFQHSNTTDTLNIIMANSSVAKLDEIEFESITYTLSDSITFVLSKQAFNNILN